MVRTLSSSNGMSLAGVTHIALVFDLNNKTSLSEIRPQSVCIPGGRGTREFFRGGVPPTSPNPDPILDQKMPFSTTFFRSGLKNPYPFSDLTLKIYTRFQT